jgi:hypothetical protein
MRRSGIKEEVVGEKEERMDMQRRGREGAYKK